MAASSSSANVITRGMRGPRAAPGTVKPEQLIHLADADSTMTKIFNLFGDSSDDGRELIIDTITEAFIQGTSDRRDWSLVHITVSGVTIPMKDIVDLMPQAADNNVRAFIRSYRQGEIAARAREMLSNVDNDVIRTQQIYNFGAAREMAPLCFDFAEALRYVPKARSPMLSYQDREFIRKCTARNVDSSRAMLADVDGESRVATGTKAHGKANKSDNNSVPMATQNARIGASDFPYN